MDGVGTLAKMGIKDVAGWDTAYSAVDVAIPFSNETLTANWERIVQNSLIGYGGRLPSEQGNFIATGTTTHELDYNNFTALFKAAMGSEAGGVVTIDDTLAVFKWLEFEKQISRHRFGAAMVTKMTITGERGGLIEVAFDWVAKSFDNSATAFPAITPSTMTKVRFQDLVFRLADQGDAIAAGDAMEIDNFEITFDRQMKFDDYVARSSNPTLPIIPIENDFRASSFTIRFPRYSADTIVDWKEADTPLMADFTFIRGGESVAVELPEIRIDEGFNAEIGGPAAMTIDGGFDCFRSSSGNPMYVGNEMRITVV